MNAANSVRVRPRGIEVLSMWSVVVGLGITALAIVAVYVVRLIPTVLEDPFADVPEALVAIALGLTAFHLVMAYGLWNLRPWARVLAIGFAGVAIVFGMLTLPLGFASVMISIATVWYLSEAKVRAAFRPIPSK